MNRIDLLRFMRRAAQLVPEAEPYLSEQARRAMKDASDLAVYNVDYHDRITNALLDYFKGGSITAPRNAFKRATTQYFADAFILGFQDGGGEMPLDADANAWLDARINEEFGNVDMLFEQAKQLRNEEDFDYFSWITARADGYTATLASIYNSGAMWAKRNQILTWHLGATTVHCETCLSLNGNSHRASWYISRDYIPRKPGASMDCGGYNCDCRLEDRDGNEVTI